MGLSVLTIEIIVNVNNIREHPTLRCSPLTSQRQAQNKEAVDD